MYLPSIVAAADTRCCQENTCTCRQPHQRSGTMLMVGLHAVCLGCHFAWPRCGDPTHHLPAAQVLDMRGVSVLSGSLPATYGNWTNLRELRYRAKSCCNLSQSCVVILHASPHMTG